jgi:predicted DNA-binding protein (MmcQ/YjbR family)
VRLARYMTEDGRPALDGSGRQALDQSMNADEFHIAALDLPGAAFDVKWGSERTYCIGGKIFATAGRLGDPNPLYGFKASDLTFELLLDQGLARPMPYIGRAKWALLVRHNALPPDELMTYVKRSYDMIAAKLTKAVRVSLGVAA